MNFSFEIQGTLALAVSNTLTRTLNNPLGIRLEPMCWDEASALIADGTLTSLAKLGRLPSDTRKYRKFRSEHILATYASVTDYLYASVFNLECKTKGRNCLNIYKVATVAVKNI